MIRIYLLVNAALYFIFAAWCTHMPDKTATGIGLAFRSGSGRSEYLTVYGGLQLGMSLFFLFTGLRADYRIAGLLFALCLYGSLSAYRLATFATVSGIERATYVFGGLEVLLALIAAVLWWSRS